MVRFLTATVAALAAGVALSATAQAAPEDDFLAVLANTPGVTVNGLTGPMLTGAGQQACGHLRDGMSIDDTTAAMMWYPGASTALMRALVGAAHQTLCPDVKAS